jgi:hypothetical protein
MLFNLLQSILSILVFLIHATWRDVLRILENQNPKRLTPMESMIIADLVHFLRYISSKDRSSQLSFTDEGGVGTF